MPGLQELYNLQTSDTLNGKIVDLLNKAKTPQCDARILKDIAILIVNGGYYEFFVDAQNLLHRCAETLSSDITVYQALAYASWVNGDTETCFKNCTKAIALNHSDANTYRTLGMYYLTQGSYLEAFTALSTGILYCTEKQWLKSWLVLATVLMKGITTARFEFKGMTFTFNLSCFNSQAMEMANNHVHSNLYEADELLFLAKMIDRCSTIVEVGSLVGNHTLFFAKALHPDKIIVFDADQRSIEQTRKNLELNRNSPDFPPQLELIHAAVGNEPGEVVMFGKTVKKTNLDSNISGQVDLLKIDVDGMELDVLAGSRNLITRCRPLIMIEVGNTNRDLFLEYCTAIDYSVVHAFPHNGYENFFVAPSERAPLPG